MEERKGRAVGGAVVGVANCQRCCYGHRELLAVLLWASRATDGAAMSVVAAVAVAIWAVVGIAAAGKAAVGVASYRQCCCGRRELSAVLL